MPVAAGTEIYYTLSCNGAFFADPIPNTEGTLKYNGAPIEIKGKTTVKAVAVNVFGVKSDVGIFEYTVAPEAPKASPSAVIGGDRLPIVPVSAVRGSVVKYEINGFENEFVCSTGSFYIDTSTGNAYLDKDCTDLLGTANTAISTSQAVLDIWAELDGVESRINRYVYTLSSDPDALAAPYADKDTGEYEEINVDGNNTLLIVGLHSLNKEDTIQYKMDSSGEWKNYDGNGIKLTSDTVLQIRSEKDGKYSAVASYVYHFVPLAPVITLPSGRYTKIPFRQQNLSLIAVFQQIRNIQ